MDATRDTRETRFDELHAEATAALAYAANTVDSIAERYREAFRDELARYQALRDELEAFDRRSSPKPAKVQTAGVTASKSAKVAASRSASVAAAQAAEAGAGDAQARALRSRVETVESELGSRQAELGRLDLAHKSLESAWLFLERGDASLVADDSAGGRPTEMDMRIVEAQEAERSRLAQEIHDGPAQALSNAIFQVEYIERVIDEDKRIARTELRYMRERLRRELGDVRTFISQLRPPLLDQLGLDGSIHDAAETMAALMGTTVEADLRAPVDLLSEPRQTVVLRIVQEALQNVRKHAKASRTTISTFVADGAWMLEVRDDGLGFDAGAVAARGRRNFGLQFMRERADLIGGTLEVSSRPEAGTVVRLAIPIEEEVR